ncbi:hypothetical protein NECID01_0904 [Nematocida sp. AWRm77]|nr:hypothetical protein NECID01_0904 [Nematocida sp. AWRm77]
MEDKEETLKEFGIAHNKWEEEQPPSTEVHTALPSPLKESQKECNPREKEFDPYTMVALLIQDLDLTDLNNAQMSLRNSLNTSVLEREKLVRRHFRVFVKCRVVMESISHLKDHVEGSKVLARLEGVKVLEQILGPMLREHKILDRREKQLEFMRAHRLLFKGPEILEEHLSIADFPSFLSDYAEAKRLADEYKNSKFVAFLWARFVKVVACFKTEISRKIETSTSIVECIHFFSLYVQIEPHSTGRMFGTFLTVANKEFYKQVEHLVQRAASGVASPHKALIEHAQTLVHAFVFMARAMAAADFIYTQDRHMEEFVESGEKNLADACIEGIDVLFSAYERDTSASACFDQQLLHTASEIVQAVHRAEEALDLEDIPIPKTRHIASLHHRLLALLLAQAHTLPQEKLPRTLRKVCSLIPPGKETTKHAKQTVLSLLGALVHKAPSAEHALKDLLLLRARTLPELADVLPDLAPAVEQEIEEQERALQGKAIHALRKQLEKASSEEEFLMKVLRTKTNLTLLEACTESTVKKVLQGALLQFKPTPLLQHYLRKYLPHGTDTASPAEDPRVPALEKQLSLLLK